MSSNQSGEGEIRQKIVEADLVDCMIALPGQLFYGSQIPVFLWSLIPPSPPDSSIGRCASATGLPRSLVSELSNCEQILT